LAQDLSFQFSYATLELSFVLRFAGFNCVASWVDPPVSTVAAMCIPRRRLIAVVGLVLRVGIIVVVRVAFIGWVRVVGAIIIAPRAVIIAINAVVGLDVIIAVMAVAVLARRHIVLLMTFVYVVFIAGFTMAMVFDPAPVKAATAFAVPAVG